MAPEDSRDLIAARRDRGGLFLCGAHSRAGACRLGIRTAALGDDKTARFDIACPESFESAPGIADGGWIAEGFADAMPYVLYLQGHLVSTGTLTDWCLGPVPIRHPLVARAWVERVDRGKWHVASDLQLASSGAPLATAESVWTERERRAHYGGFEQWLAEQESQEVDESWGGKDIS